MYRSIWLFLAACNPDPLGTRESPPPLTDGPDAAGTGSLDPSEGEESSPGDSSEPTESDPCALDVPDPGAPGFPSTIGTLTVTIQTGNAAATNGTDDETLELCLTATDCFPLTQGKGTQLAVGATGVWMFDNVGLDRALVDRVELRVSNGVNQWRPARLDLRFDGEPVHCADIVGVPIGTDAGDLPSWADPLGLHVACTSAWADRVLTHGPMVGATGPDRANLWVRTDATRPVHVEIWPTEQPEASRVAAWAYPRAEDDFTASLQAGCLEPDTAYTYQIWVDGAPAGLPGSLKTAPAAGEPGRWTMAFGSCSNAESQPIFASILADQPDWFAFVGDNHYANTTHLDSLRWYYRWALEKFERGSLVRHTPVLATWDDHDYTGNNTDGNVVGKENALKAFSEYWANPSFGLPGTEGVFFKHAWGDVDLFFLDIRYWRGVEGNMLGQAQHDWLLQELAASEATFKLLVDGSQWSFDGAGDSWADFPNERDELFQHIADEDIDGVVLLSGDIHRAEVREIVAPGYPLPEIISSALAQKTPGTCHAAYEPELLTCRDGANYYVSITVDTLALEPALTAEIHAEDGAVVDRFTWTLAALSN